MTLSEAIYWAADILSQKGIVTARLDAEILLLSLMGLDKNTIYIHPDDLIHSDKLDNYRELINRRVEGEPVAYIIGRKEFWSLSLKIKKGVVLVPRPETETVIETILGLIKDNNRVYYNILDIGTGSGNIAIAVAKEIKNCKVIATDISFDALKIAQLNADYCGFSACGKISFICADIFDAIKPKDIFDAGFDFILSNPPYIPTCELSQLSREIKYYEPLIALDGGADGLFYYKKIIRDAYNLLSAKGYIILEIGYSQAGNIYQIVKDTGMYNNIQFRRDISGTTRVVLAQKV